ncbi:unnamed protein product [Pleuronectes platessa]|uniref:Uncharacterized protein n=1 Tax=Pleuronectes platessa TaxID=8262 RepID=A0A9N7YQ91_PLEPL|nr:unnamed protein product [Pleuronectes platessa]
MLRVVPSTILDWQMKRRTELFLPARADAGSSVRQRQSERPIRGGKRNHLGLSRSFCDSPDKTNNSKHGQGSECEGGKERSSAEGLSPPRIRPSSPPSITSSPYLCGASSA